MHDLLDEPQLKVSLNSISARIFLLYHCFLKFRFSAMVYQNHSRNVPCNQAVSPNTDPAARLFVAQIGNEQSNFKVGRFDDH